MKTGDRIGAPRSTSDKIRPEPDHRQYLETWSAAYEHTNYDEGLAGYFLKKSHAWAERHFGPDASFPEVLEVGAGTGVHVRFIRHAFEHYWLTDLNPPFLEKIAPSPEVGRDRIRIQAEDATALSFADDTFDRVIAAHVLEHLEHPHRVLREWTRVLRPGGVLSLVLPCDPGIAWRFGRMFGPRRKFTKAGLAYDYWMAREHVNAISNLVSFVRYYFENPQEEWLPFGVPSIDLNLFYIAHLRV